MQLKSPGDTGKERLQSALSTWNRQNIQMISYCISTDRWANKLLTLANLLSWKADTKTRFWPQRRLTKGVNDAIKHRVHKMDWLLMKAGVVGGWQGCRTPPWGKRLQRSQPGTMWRYSEMSSPCRRTWLFLMWQPLRLKEELSLRWVEEQWKPLLINLQGGKAE